jgi:hypothetical protein
MPGKPTSHRNRLVRKLAGIDQCIATLRDALAQKPPTSDKYAGGLERLSYFEGMRSRVEDVLGSETHRS